jgi:predicted nuclease of predicted toxin-antitoxin system
MLKNYALVIITFDEGFQNLEFLYGFPPKVILFRTGNTSIKSIFEIIKLNLDSIIKFYQDETLGLLEVF